VLVASSDLEELLTLTHRVLVLRAGRIVADLPTPTTSRDTVAHLMMLDTAPVEGMRP
jgi:ABC-type sugar transport system ATPase subunit